MTVPASLSKWAHPPRSNTPRSSSSGPPGPCITPSTETCVVVVSFMVRPFSRVQVSGVTTVLRCWYYNLTSHLTCKSQHETGAFPTRILVGKQLQRPLLTRIGVGFSPEYCWDLHPPRWLLFRYRVE